MVDQDDGIPPVKEFPVKSNLTILSSLDQESGSDPVKELSLKSK